MKQTERKPLFDLGQLVASPGALIALDKSGQNVVDFLSRHDSFPRLDQLCRLFGNVHGALQTRHSLRARCPCRIGAVRSIAKVTKGCRFAFGNRILQPFQRGSRDELLAVSQDMSRDLYEPTIRCEACLARHHEFIHPLAP
jgi:hypothetical protein